MKHVNKQAQQLWDGADTSLNVRRGPCEGVKKCAGQRSIGPLHDPVTWYGINYTGTQVAQWDFQNKGKSGWTGTSSFVLEVPLRKLRPSVIYSVPCDQIVQRAYQCVYHRQSFPCFHWTCPAHMGLHLAI